MCGTVYSITRFLYALLSMKCFQHSFHLLLVQIARIKWKNWSISYTNVLQNCLCGKLFGPNSFLPKSSLLLRLPMLYFNWISLQFPLLSLTSLLLWLLVILWLLYGVLIGLLFLIKSSFAHPAFSLLLKNCSCNLIKNASYRTAALIESFPTGRQVSLRTNKRGS